MRALETLGGVGGGIPERYGGGRIWGKGRREGRARFWRKRGSCFEGRGGGGGGGPFKKTTAVRLVMGFLEVLWLVMGFCEVGWFGTS